MRDIKETLEEYERSHALIKGRIHELNAQISGRVPTYGECSAKKLNERRSLLYTQLWDIEYAIRELGEYFQAIYGSEVSRKIG